MLISVFCSILYRPMATVQSAERPEFRIILAITKSVHGTMKELMMVYTRMGLDMGRTTWKNTRASDAPSSFAASRRETGMVSKKPLQIR